MRNASVHALQAHHVSFFPEIPRVSCPSFLEKVDIYLSGGKHKLFTSARNFLTAAKGGNATLAYLSSIKLEKKGGKRRKEKLNYIRY